MTDFNHFICKICISLDVVHSLEVDSPQNESVFTALTSTVDPVYSERVGAANSVH